MPEMDGLEATARIRAREKESGQHVPIVALTAHALKGDRDACLAAGMDDYLSKPVRAAELLDVISRLSSGAKEAPLVSTTLVPSRPSFNPEEILERVEGDREFLRELVDIFLAETPKTFAEIERCATEGDAGGLERAAHLMRGSVSHFGANAAVESARALEQMGRSGLTQEASARVAELGRALESLYQDLKGMLET